MRHFRIQDICCFGRVIALDAQFFSPHDLQTAAHAAGLGIDDPDDSAREFLHQLFGCRYGCLIGAADAGSHGNINDIHALFQRRRKAFDELIGIDQTGLDGSAVFESFIEIMKIEIFEISVIDPLFAIDDVVTWHHGYIFCLFLRQIGCAVRKYFKHKNTLSLIYESYC